MANSDKNIVITPNRNLGGIPDITLTGAGNSSISLKIPDSSTATLNFESSGTNLLSIDANISTNSQFSVGNSSIGKVLDINQIGNLTLNAEKIITSGKGLKLPKIKPSQSSSTAGKVAYDSIQKTLVVNDSKTWINYGPEQEGCIQNGLILYYDASRPESYPGSGNTVYDISGSSLGSGEFTGSMSNVGFSTYRGGAFVFNGSTSYIDVLNSADILRDFSSYTVEWYVRITQNINAEIFGNYGTGYTTNHLWISARYGHYINTSNPYFTSTTYTDAAPLPSTYTHHSAVTRDSQTRNTAIYLNGVLNNTSTADTRINNTINYRIGMDVNSSGEPFGGDLYAIRVYNRLLTAKEIQMNFNATRSRVGL